MKKEDARTCDKSDEHDDHSIVSESDGEDEELKSILVNRRLEFDTDFVLHRPDSPHFEEASNHCVSALHQDRIHHGTCGTSGNDDVNFSGRGVFAHNKDIITHELVN